MSYKPRTISIGANGGEPTDAEIKGRPITVCDTSEVAVTEPQSFEAAFRQWHEDFWRGVYYGDGHISGTLDIKRGGLLPHRETTEDAKLIAAGNAALKGRRWN